MIYLFNSAYNKTYLENVYRLAGLPVGVRVDMRYSIGANAPALEADAAMNGKVCTICYIDRFTDTYQYIPFRRAVIRSIRREQTRVYYSLELGSYCHSDAPKDFTRTIQSAIPDSPRLTDANSLNAHDGIYAVQGADEADNFVQMTQDSWSKAIDQIYQTRPFLTEAPAFFFVRVERKGENPKASKSGLELHANTEYQIEVHYRYPFSRHDSGHRRILVRMGTEMNREMTVGSPADRLVIPITLPPLDFAAGAIIIETLLETKGSTGGETRYTASVPFRTSAWQSNLVLFGFLFLISFLDEFRKVGWDLGDGGAWASTFFQFLKFGIVIWAVFKYRGKLKLPGL